MGFGWDLWLHFALVHLPSLRRSKTASRLILAKQESLFLSSGVTNGTITVLETQIELCLPFVDPHQREVREFAVIFFVDLVRRLL